MAVATATVNSTLPFRLADFETLTEGLDYAAGGETGINFYSPRGELETALSHAELREQSGGRRAEDIEEEVAPSQEGADEFDPSATYYDFIAQTGITPGTGE